MARTKLKASLTLRGKYSFGMGGIPSGKFGCYDIIICDQGREFVNQVKGNFYALTAR